MIGAHRRRMEKLDREDVFFTDNLDDFKNPPAFPLTTAIKAKMALILDQDAKLTSSFDDKAQSQEIKGDRRDDLIDRIAGVVLGAKAIGDTAVPGITTLFRMPEQRTEQSLIAKATAMFTETLPYEALFITAGLDADFRNQLIAARDAFEQARDDANAAAGHHGEAVGAIAELFREVMSISRQRDAIVLLKYNTNPGKLAAWAIASHLDKAPKPTPPPTPTP